jgi:hypothetical protein
VAYYPQNEADLPPEQRHQYKGFDCTVRIRGTVQGRKTPVVKVLGKHKEQIQLERRIHDLKGPLAVTPMFLQNPVRIAGLLCILV